MINREPIYTETLSTLLENKGYGTASQDAVLTEILELMNKFPNFSFNSSINFSFIDLFLKKYDIREIGCEDEDLFLHFWRETTQELIIKYVPKIVMWKDNFNDLFKFTVNLSLNDDSKFSNGTQNTYYLNPVNASTNISKEVVIDQHNNKTTITYSGGNLKTQDIDTTDNNGEKNRKVNRDVLQSVWGKTRPVILKQIMELEDIYNSCIKEFETIFMGVY